MAIYHTTVRRVCHADAYKDVNHSPSAVASAAYITGMRLYDASADVVRDYTENADGDRTHRVAHVGVALPEGAPEKLRDVATLANAMERGGGRKDAQTGRTVEYSLPRECSREEQIEIAESIAKGFTREGMCVIWAIHDDGDGNPHVHMLVSVRPLKPEPTWDPARPENVWGAKTKCAYLVRDGTGREAQMTAADLKSAIAKGEDWAKVYNWKGYDTPDRVRLTMAEAEGRDGLTRCSKQPVRSNIAATDWETKAALVRWRKLIADEINAGLDRHSAANPGTPAIKHVSHLSNKARGIPTVPTVHVGTRSRMGKRDEYRERRLRLNARIREHNAAIVNLIRRSVRVIPELVASWADQDRTKNTAWSLAKRNIKRAKSRRAALARKAAEEAQQEAMRDVARESDDLATSTEIAEQKPSEQVVERGQMKSKANKDGQRRSLFSIFKRKGRGEKAEERAEEALSAPAQAIVEPEPTKAPEPPYEPQRHRHEPDEKATSPAPLPEPAPVPKPEPTPRERTNAKVVRELEREIDFQELDGGSAGWTSHALDCLWDKVVIPLRAVGERELADLALDVMDVLDVDPDIQITGTEISANLRKIADAVEAGRAPKVTTDYHERPATPARPAHDPRSMAEAAKRAAAKQSWGSVAPDNGHQPHL